MNEIKIFSPATVANVSCGFDVLGFCLDSVGDEMIIRKTDKKGIYITKIKGFDLPFEPELNVAGVSALTMYKAAKPNCGFEIEIYKKIKPGSGIGSSAASAVGSVFGMNELLGKPFNKTELTAFAIKGEALASKCEHADNLAPAMFGGFTLVKSLSPLQILEIPSPDDLYATIIHPQIEIKTSEARAILPKNIPLSDAITQWANFGSLIHALHTSNFALIESSLHDAIVEPYRSQLIPYFIEVKQAALQAGALGAGISGSGPSIFTLSKGIETAINVEQAMRKVYSKTAINFDIHISKINKQGIKILS
ncbi:MAG: homoserine kinase [Flavobacteriales bacterium]|nr:homoserine kinase [Flavobacteriia bacterium]NCP06398.1 homoserine kinase [Flavobacteriales bacterium]PIV94914.1 MAG: homoserine kinase [Flavobacteriaceae bacterium CG17_big_fil_post_rev_8_21_14_2_50_33_15]PIY09546.1 MAG: homoserine kinase [Flavobacteriaceae bacterium CG_4_10_14_3_um_filter_33_47]PJB17497.1 MAG: homoserine kinase [Flavobacteriaceae bacterium CG_4_9_14_3_um_filter_33_16]